MVYNGLMNVGDTTGKAQTPEPVKSAADALLGIYPQFEAEMERRTKRCEPEETVNWAVVRLLVEKYTERHPEEVVGCMEYVKTLKAAAKDRKFGQVQDGDGGSQMRHLMEIPDRLETALTMKYPLIFKGKNLKKFHGLYPVFFIPEKI